MGERDSSLNPAADKSRMAVALGVLVVLGLLAWFTIDSSAVLHVAGRAGRGNEWKTHRWPSG